MKLKILRFAEVNLTMPTRQIADTNAYGRALVHQFLFALEPKPRLNHE